MVSQKSALKIAILDSGSGGLAILQELCKKLPHAHFEYLCDNLFFPFGEQESSFIQTRFVHLATSLYEKNKPDLIVIACNTASTVILDSLRKKISIPIVGVVPAVKTASQISKSKTIGILATKRTIESTYLENLTQEFASSCKVIKRASPNLVTLSEKKITGERVDIDLLRSEIQGLIQDKNLDTIVLGCTHFSQLIPELKEASQREINWIDSTEAIARRVLSLLNKKTTQEKSTTGSLKIFYTAETLKQDAWKKHFPFIKSFHLFP